ncbi:DUF6059 family protein [Streptomyces sp. NPDC050433]|uniref:DUF6059 family protein n=1 Tax=unclassified Streptomyces TaxID=2593676 RepID=UPI0034467722
MREKRGGMGPRSWLDKAVTGVWNMLVEYGSLTVGPLAGVHFDDPAPDPDHTPQEARPPQATHGRGNGARLQGPPTGHPERHCPTPPSRVEQELWAGLGVDVKKAGQ